MNVKIFLNTFNALESVPEKLRLVAEELDKCPGTLAIACQSDSKFREFLDQNTFELSPLLSGFELLGAFSRCKTAQDKSFFLAIWAKVNPEAVKAAAGKDANFESYILAEFPDFLSPSPDI